MADGHLGGGVGPPDFYLAAIGRSGSTALSNWLARPPEQLVFLEPFFLRPRNPRLLRIQLADFGMPVADDEWDQDDETAADRFRRLMWPRLKGRRWAFKEVLCEEHVAVLEAFAPPRILITVRDIRDIALSLFEKHRLQNNLDRFDDQWVVDYCVRESAGIVEFQNHLRGRSIPFLTLRYEDFTRSEAVRQAAANFVGWEGGGAVERHFSQLDRTFEVERHGSEFSGRLRRQEDRTLGKRQFALAQEIVSRCVHFQATFGYG